MSVSQNKTYIAIDLKSFYASVECAQRGLDPLTTNLVVADTSRTEKTICLAVSPALKQYGIPGRCRLFEVNEKVREINALRRSRIRHDFTGGSVSSTELAADPSLKLDFIAATPQMSRYIQISTQIVGIYLRYIAPEDIHVYSVDEVFMDVTGYLETYGLSAHDLARRMIREVLHETGITATAGIGTNLYLCKVAMDIVAKHIPADEDGVRIAELDERSYRRQLWDHKPVRDFWRVGRGIAKRLNEVGLETMGDVARCSLGGPNDFYNEDLLYKMFGVNAELLIDHAWGWEPCTIRDIKRYKPKDNSLGAGQVLSRPYSFSEGKIIVREMAEALSLQLVEKGLVTDQIVLHIDYDKSGLSAAGGETSAAGAASGSGAVRTSGKPQGPAQAYQGPVTTDYYGRLTPKPAHGSCNLPFACSSMKQIEQAAVSIYDSVVKKNLTIRRVVITAAHVLTEEESRRKQSGQDAYEQLDLFTDYEAKRRQEKAVKEQLDREKRLQESMLSIRKKFGNNAIVRGISYEEGATGRQRNEQIGGHRA